MTEAILLQAFFKIFMALSGLLAARGMLIWLDHAAPMRWMKEADGNAKAFYYSMRFFAVCVLVGFAVS